MRYSLARWDGGAALVTGASSGIGRAVARALAGSGFDVAVSGRDARRLRAVARAVENCGRRTLILSGDLAEGATARDNVRRVVQAWGRLHVLVNNAGCDGGEGFADVSETIRRACFDLNVHAAASGMQEAWRVMRCQRDGAIINISSLAGHRLPLRPGASAIYAASKHALSVLTEGLRREVAVRHGHIKVALVSPGMVDTPWHPQHKSRDRVRAYGFEPLQPSDVAQAVLFVLAAPRRVQISDILMRSACQID